MIGHNPFAVLHVLHNVDDKAVVSAWLSRPPAVVWQCSDDDTGISIHSFKVNLWMGAGEGNVEYALKYGLKPMGPAVWPAGDFHGILSYRVWSCGSPCFLTDNAQQRHIWRSFFSMMKLENV